MNRLPSPKRKSLKRRGGGVKTESDEPAETEEPERKKGHTCCGSKQYRHKKGCPNAGSSSKPQKGDDEESGEEVESTQGEGWCEDCGAETGQKHEKTCPKLQSRGTNPGANKYRCLDCDHEFLSTLTDIDDIKCPEALRKGDGDEHKVIQVQ